MPVKVDWDAVKASPVEFAKVMLKHPDGSPCIPHPAQEQLLTNRARRVVAVTGRQFGKTVSMAWLATWFAATHAHRNVFILAPTVDQSRLIFNDIALQFRSPSPLAKLVVGKIKSYPFPEIELKNGTVIMGRGLNSPEYVRGKRAHLAIIDEAAFIRDGVIREVVEPMFTVTGQEADSSLVLISSPFGQGEFYEQAQKCKGLNNDRGRYFEYTSFDNPYADREYLKEQMEFYGEESLVWRTEYMGEFADSDLAVFPTGDIKEAYLRWPEGLKFPVAPVDGHRYGQGVDLANLRDYFVSSVVDMTERDAVQLVRMDRFQKRGYEHYKSTARSNHSRYHNARTLIDATSLGESVVDDLSDISAEGYKFGSNEAKYQVVQELARMMSEGRWIIPFDKDIISEYTYFQYKVTPSKVLRMEAARGHDDIVMSHALCAHLACIPRSTASFMSVDFSPRKPKPSDVDPFWQLCNIA